MYRQTDGGDHPTNEGLSTKVCGTLVQSSRTQQLVLPVHRRSRPAITVGLAVPPPSGRSARPSVRPARRVQPPLNFWLASLQVCEAPFGRPLHSISVSPPRDPCARPARSRVRPTARPRAPRPRRCPPGLPGARRARSPPLGARPLLAARRLEGGGRDGWGLDSPRDGSGWGLGPGTAR